jgi:PIN domain nuclease of toxin-antitoxin system
MPLKAGREIVARHLHLLMDREWLVAIKIPNLHRDPFDRMLICQAIVNGLGILTPDELISQYPIRVLW